MFSTNTNLYIKGVKLKMCMDKTAAWNTYMLMDKSVAWDAC